MERKEAMNTHNNQTPKILVAEEIEGKRIIHDINSELDTLYVNALKRLSKKKSKEQETEPKAETELEHEVFVNPEADELAMVEGGEELSRYEESIDLENLNRKLKNFLSGCLWIGYWAITILVIYTGIALFMGYFFNTIIIPKDLLIIGILCGAVWLPLTIIGSIYSMLNRHPQNEFANGLVLGFLLGRWWR